MDNKEQARVKAEAKFVYLGRRGQATYFRATEDHYRTFSEGGKYHDFPFTDLKDGDACLCDDNSYRKLFYYYNDAFYDGFQNGRFQDECPNVTLIKKTGFNILEHKEGEK